MGVILILLFGGIAGLISSYVMGTDSGKNVIGDVVLGVFGAVVGGFLMNLFAAPGAQPFDIYSVVVSIVAATVVVYTGRLLQHT